MPPVRPTLRELLADSHIAAVAIVVLLILALDSGVRAIGRPLISLADFLVNVAAISGLPYGFGFFSLGYWLPQIPTFTHIINAVSCASAAWVLSIWVYKLGPLRSLTQCRSRLARRNHA
jgi:hypothetical protein